MMNRRTYLASIALICTVSLSGVTAQETHSLHAERTIDWQQHKVTDLKAQVGQVRIASVELSDMGHNYSGGGLASRMRPGSDSEASTTIRAHFLAENPTSEDWQVS